MVITIDGPAGSGKSTVARKLAARLGVAYLDTGAMYRAIALRALRAGIDMADAAALTEIARHADVEVDCGPTHTRVLLDAEDVSEAIRTMEVNCLTGYVARLPAIREMLVLRQRQIGRTLGSFVTEGRDQGSVVFPNADLKVVMDATPERRAKRRHLEMMADGESATYQEILDNLITRDNNDAHQWAALLRDPDTVRIDTSHLSIQEVVDQLAETIESRRCAGREVNI